MPERLMRLSDLLPKLPPRQHELVPDFGCPYCGGGLVERQGPHHMFLGCRNYPECDYTENLPCG